MLNQEQLARKDELRGVLEEYRSLVKSPGWARLARLLDNQKNARKAQIGDNPIANLEEAFRRNYEIGVTHGLGAVPQLLRTTVEEVKAEYDQLLDQEREDAERNSGE